MTLATTDVGGITLAGSRCRWHEPCNTTCGWHNPCYAYAHVYSPRARVTRAVAHAHVTTWAPRNCPDVAPGRPRTRPDGSRATRVACGLMARCSASHEQHTRACLHAHVPRWIFFPRNWCGAHPAPSVALPVFAHLREPLGWHAACTCPLHEPLPLLHQALRRTPRQTHACAPMGRRCHLLAHCEGGCAHSGTPEARGVGSLHRVIPESVGGGESPLPASSVPAKKRFARLVPRAARMQHACLPLLPTWHGSCRHDPCFQKKFQKNTWASSASRGPL